VVSANVEGNLRVYGSKDEKDITNYNANPNRMIDMREVAKHHDAQFVFNPASGNPCTKSNGCEPYLNPATGAALFNVAYVYHLIFPLDEKLSMSSGSFADGTTDRTSPGSHKAGNNIDLRFMGSNGKVLYGDSASKNADVFRTLILLNSFKLENAGLNHVITGSQERFGLPPVSERNKYIHRNHMHFQTNDPSVAPRKPGSKKK
jgi:hypothetical protein